jgi:small basic protein (TIGR04137 family)
MTIDKSLKVRRGMARARSVFTRAERLERLKAADRWKEGDDVLGLPKVRVPKLALKKKKKEKKEGEEGAAAPAAGGKPAAGAKPAAAAAAKPAAKGAKK